MTKLFVLIRSLIRTIQQLWKN